ncbi:protein MANBAL isoform 2-T2 [Trichechus inunguis]
MASDLDFSPPEVPEPTFLENLLRYGLFLGAIFQLICVLAIIVPVPKSYEAVPATRCLYRHGVQLPFTGAFHAFVPPDINPPRCVWLCPLHR